MRKLFGGFALSAALVVALVVGSATAQQTQSTTVELTPSRDSRVTGTATLTEVAGGVETTVTVEGLPKAGVEHLAHIHEGGTCADDRAGNGAPVEFPLNSLVAEGDGTGSSTTVVEGATVAQLFSSDSERYINVHFEQEGEETPPGISCADLVMTTPDSDLPETGGLPLLPLAGGLMLVGFGCLLLKRRLS